MAKALTPPSPDDPFSSPPTRAQIKLARQIRSEMREFLDRFQPPDDIAAALKESEPVEGQTYDDDFWLRRSALVFHFLDRDPAAAFKWAKETSKNFQLLDGVAIELGPEFFRRMGAEKALEMVSHAPADYYQIRAEVGRSIGEHADASGFLAAAKMMSGQQGEWFARTTGGEWPPEKEGELIQAAVDAKSPMLIIGYLSEEGRKGDFLAELVLDELLPADFREMLRTNEWTREILARTPEVPVSLRLELGNNIDAICSGDLIKLLTTDRDWAFAFRHGVADAGEILKLAEAGAPELMRDHGAKAREHLFRELAEENPRAAMPLLQNIPETERNDLLLYIARTHFEQVEPAKFLELLEQIPPGTPQQWEARLDAWNRRGATNHQRLQEAYVEWVRNLPAGIDREMGLYSLARSVEAQDPALAAELRREVSDPDLQSRINTSR
ncbi:hypothetical protein OJ996_00720 [Luteolibacter sp. GHJ8]|uniref:HEAT repeat protein n=1 Tax=Luteolibacter rhizosphaerae TaxID=2989719 RepID=A0ABT3FWV8_9BACT|nr:hypothetical protein [Luteolibacter rhizosphaerae]MCW1912075.1 hypothetical protein [Luteolibacter rhizosphaerae]